MAAQNGTLTLKGVKSGKNYFVDIYLPDAVATRWTFNPSGAAVSTSKDTYKFVEDCVLVDVSMATAPTATGCILQIDGATVNGGALRYTNQLAALPNRIKLSIGARAGQELGSLQF